MKFIKAAHEPRTFYFSLLIITISSCTTKQERSTTLFTPVIVNAGSYQLPKDSLQSPEIIPLDDPAILIAGLPKTTLTNLNVHPVPESSPSSNSLTKEAPVRCIPGKNPFKDPVVFTVTKKCIPAGVPEMIFAKDAAAKDINPSNFAFYKVLQGLKQSAVRCTYQDRAGNIWLGTYSGGASRFDGKAFTHFTETQGLSNNVVFSILEDKQGKIWFGTNGGGACCYDGKTFTYFTKENGFVNDAVYCMMEDKNGNLWFGTNGSGVCKYDGKSFTQYTQDQGLIDNTVFSIFEDKNHTVWFGTMNGASCFDSNGFTNFNTKQGLASDIVLKITQDKQGCIWFGTTRGASRYDPRPSARGVTDGNTIAERKDPFTNFTESQGLSNNIVYTILEDKNGTIWLGTAGGINSYDGRSFTHHTESEGLSNNLVYCILEDNSGSLWFGTNAGLNHYNGGVFVHFPETQGVGNSVVYSILQCRNGNIWFGTNGEGAWMYDGKSFRQYTRAQGLINSTVYSILEDRNGNVWFGIDGGISCFDGKTFKTFGEDQGLKNNIIYTMVEDNDGRIWFGTDGGGLLQYDGKTFRRFSVMQGLSSDVVYASYKDKKGRIWFGTYNGVSCYDACLPAPCGISVNDTNGQGKTFIQYAEKQGLINNMVFSILEDNRGNMWFGTNGGADLFNGSSFTHFTETQGLASNAVLGLLQDKTGNIWFGTRNGLSKMSADHLYRLPQKKKGFDPVKEALFYNYAHNDGFLGLNCRRNSLIEDKAGNIWWGADMLTCYNPLNDAINKSPPVVNITSVKLFGEKIAWNNMGALVTDSLGNEFIKGRANDTTLANGVLLSGIRFDGLSKWYNLPENLNLPYNNNHITFNFIGVHIQSRNHIKYRYKLSGLDNDWSSITEHNEATYGNLPAGVYTFNVLAMNQTGIWSEPFTYTFTVHPAWWQTWWFRLLVLLFIVAGVRFYIYIRERDRKEAKERLEQHNKELLKTNAELDRFVYSASHELRAPIASLMGLLDLTITEEADPSKLKKLNMMQTAFQRLDNFIMDIINYSRNSRLKIDHEKIHFDQIIRNSLELLDYLPEREHIKINTHIDDKIEFYSDQKRISVLFNNFLSNAIKYHNLKQKEPYINIRVSVKKKGAYIEIEDNGTGIPPEFTDKIFDMFYRATERKSGSGLGLYITKETIENMGGKIRVESVVNKGTTFFVFLPQNEGTTQ